MLLIDLRVFFRSTTFHLMSLTFSSSIPTLISKRQLSNVSYYDPATRAGKSPAGQLHLHGLQRCFLQPHMKGAAASAGAHQGPWELLARPRTRKGTGLLHKALYSAISHAKFAGGGLGVWNKPRSSEDLGLRCSVPDPRIKGSNYKAGGQRHNPGSLSEGTEAPECPGFLSGYGAGICMFWRQEDRQLPVTATM